MHEQKAKGTTPSIRPLEVYNRLWASRDFELTTFWQRSIFLGAFLTLSYTGYGALCLKFLKPESVGAFWQTGNLFAIGIACFGMILSALWILMAKGSKAWYEWQETAISAFVHDIAPRSAFEDEYVQEVAAFKIGWTEAFRKRWEIIGKDTHYFSSNGGPFSVSKITICIGQLSLIGWSIVGVGHLALLVLSRTTIHAYLMESGIIVLGFVSVLFSATYVLFFLRRHVASGVLDPNK